MKYNIHLAELAMTLGATSAFPRDSRPEIVLSGRSNVGKSSLINTLLGRKSLARTSSAPGKTITINYYAIDQKFYLVDLPGYGYAKRSKDSQRQWSALTERFFLQNPSADAIRLVLQLVDVRTGPTEDDRMMIDFLRRSGLPFLVIATKADKLSPSALAQTLESWERNPIFDAAIRPIPFSAVTRAGKEKILSEIDAAL